MLDYDVLADRTVRDGGFTIDLDGRVPTVGFAVATPGAERTVRVHTRADIADAIYSYVIHHGARLRMPDRYVGGWLQGDRLFLDVSQVVPSLDLALKLGRARGRARDQLAVHDLATHTDHTVRS